MGVGGFAYPWLVGNEGMDPYSSPYTTHYCSFHFLFTFPHSQQTNGKFGTCKGLGLRFRVALRLHVCTMYALWGPM